MRLSPWARADLFWLLLCSVAVTLAFFLTPGPERVALAGWSIPEICFWKQWFGVSCIGCGLTRSWTYLAHGDVKTAFSMNMIGPILFLATCLQVPITAFRLWRRTRAKEAHAVPDP
jgi:hypothetical protein